MKYFLDSAKLDEIQYAYKTFGIDGVTTNPRHIMLSGKPFMIAITDIAKDVYKRQARFVFRPFCLRAMGAL